MGIIHFRFYDVTSCDFTSNPVAILLPVMRNDTFYTNTIVRKKRGEKTSLPVMWLPFMSHPLAMLLPVMHNCTFRTTAMVRKKAQNILRLWRHFRSRDFMWRHFRSGPLPVTSLLVTQTQWHYFDIWIWGDPIDNPWTNIEGRHSSFPLGD